VEANTTWNFGCKDSESFILRALRNSIDLLHKSEKGEALADKNPDFTDKVGRKCFAPTAKNRRLPEEGKGRHGYWGKEYSSLLP